MQTTNTMTQSERWHVRAIEAKGREFLALIDELRTPPQMVNTDVADTAALGMASQAAAIVRFDRELNIAAERIEEAVMWAIKHVTT
ncbi:hypothetical protein [Rhizobium sp. CSW-27]|uniref:Acb2/Tad1 domain-containing protein n=1 Tax=Rhizobium sp. CSW-27 TaxID=2839985 RepID=UPI001C02A9B0|nr:hypothetical protein [Rhizobium sp. CSW-27]MBT9370302.1 hypothetical protein [Rhizobium sp. CSW-27]